MRLSWLVPVPFLFLGSGCHLYESRYVINDPSSRVWTATPLVGAASCVEVRAQPAPPVVIVPYTPAPAR